MTTSHKTKKGGKIKTKKKYFIIGGIFLVIILLTGLGLVAAWGPCGGFDRHFHPGFHSRGLHKGFYNEDFSEFLLWQLDKRVGKLDLTSTQKDEYEEIKGKIETRLKEGFKDRKRLMEEFHAEINSENPDIRLLVENIRERIKDISGFMEENLDLFMEFYETLDGAQKDRVIGAIRDRMEYHCI